MLFISNFIYSQNTLHFTLNDCKTKEPISFAHIGIREKGIGTISDEQGVVNLFTPKEYLNFNLTISYVGYETKDLAINSIKSNLEICPSEILIREVVIIPKKEKILGRKNGKGNSTFIYQGISNGGEIATKFSNKKSIILKKIGFYLGCSECDSLTVGFNIYQHNNSAIGDPINSKPYIWKTVAPKEGWLDYILPRTISIEGDFYVGIEILNALNKSKCRITFEGNYQFMKSNNYTRDKSQDKWENCKISLPINVLVSY